MSASGFSLLHPSSVFKFILCISLHFATVFDILPGPTNLREEGFERKKTSSHPY